MFFMPLSFSHFLSATFCLVLPTFSNKGCSFCISTRCLILWFQLWWIILITFLRCIHAIDTIDQRGDFGISIQINQLILIEFMRIVIYLSEHVFEAIVSIHQSWPRIHGIVIYSITFEITLFWWADSMLLLLCRFLHFNKIWNW